MNPRLIALVNDEPTFRHVASTALAAAGYTVHSCSDEETARRVISEEQPSAVIVETRRGSPISGFDLVEWLRREGRDTSVVVCSPDPVFLSTTARFFSERRCAIFGKPFDIASVLNAVRDARPRLVPAPETYAIAVSGG